MKIARHLAAVAAAGIACALPTVALAQLSGTLFNDGWRFTRGDPAQAAQVDFDHAAWDAVELPHDWSIAGPFARDNPSGHSGGFLPTGVGWYRKTFDVPAGWKGQRVALEFDGSSMNTDVYLNGQKLGSHVSGFSPFEFDLTPHLKFGERNTLAVRVDNSRQPNARWYVGSGIYRHVRLVNRDPIHIARFGTFITTPAVSAASAKVQIQTRIENNSMGIAEATVEQEVLDPEGKVVGTAPPEKLMLNRAVAAVDSIRDLVQSIDVASPKRWSVETPAMYCVRTTVRVAGQVVDTRETPFGIRTIEASADKGFLLNGKSIEMFGACVHEDNGPLGVAAFDRAIIRRVEALKAAGYNAVRCAHNPPAPAFLDACDRLGLLVIDEAFDTWSAPKTRGDFGSHFKALWQDELDRMILRDRNHPSIVIWSVGNEVTLWGNRTAQSLAEGSDLIRRTKELDPTRFVTTAVAGWNLRDNSWTQMEPLLARFDIVGYNYALHRYETDHAKFPNRIILGTESFPRDIFQTFDTADRFTHVIGDFVWTGIDYMGESGIGQYRLPGAPAYFHLDTRQFPYHGAYCGDIDITGFRKPVSYFRNITWDKGEKLYTAVIEPTPDGRPWGISDWAVAPAHASWTWPGSEGKPLTVEVYSRHDAVRLYLNDTLLGEKPTTRTEKFKASFSVPYAPGTLKTVAIKNGQEVETNTLTTAGPIAGLRLTPDRKVLAADGQDLAFITVESVDANGRFQPTGTNNITFELSGPGSIAAVANADFNNELPYQGNQRPLFHGRAQVIVRTTRQPGSIQIRATAPSLPPAVQSLDAR